MDQNYWQLGRWRGVPVSMHWTVLIAFVWLYLFYWDLLATAIGSVAFFALLVIHELGHVLVLRRRKIAVQEIRLYGIHGETSHAYASPRDEVFIAWGGVIAQVAVLVLALAAAYGSSVSASPLAAAIAGPVLFVLVKLNVLLIVVALLPIGPFDGRNAWAIVPMLRKSARRRRERAREQQLFPERSLSPQKRRELEEASSKAAADLIGKLSGKGDQRKEDA